MRADPKTAAGRAFVRSLNILLKFARLYGFDHVRTTEQLDVAWHELRSAMPMGSEPGLLLGASGSQLLLDGVPLEGAPAEKQFAQLLSAAGLASVQFFPLVTQEELSRFTRAFPTGKAKPAELAQQLKAVLAGAQGIRINEICFVATDSRLKEASIAAQIAAATLGDDQDKFRQWLNDPQKLLELIAAAQGSTGDGAGPGSGPGLGPGAGPGADAGPGSRTGAGAGLGLGSGAGPSSGVGSGLGGGGSLTETGGTGGAGGAGFGPGPGTGGTGSGPGGWGIGSGPGPGAATGTPAALRRLVGGSGGTGGIGEQEVLGILQSLAGLGKAGAGGLGGVAPGPFQESLEKLSGNAQDMLKQALAALAAQAPEGKPDESVLIRLAEHLAIRFALERYERGEVKVNAVRQMLDRMNQEIDNLRKILGAHEAKMTDAGMLVESHGDILDRQFWAAVPESGKRAVLLSDEAWCIPPRNVRQYVAELIQKGDVAEAINILQNYAACSERDEPDARKRTAVGLAELAELYATADPKLLGEALRHLGLRLTVEQDAELQAVVSAAFVRLSQEAALHRCYPAMEQALGLISGVETQRPGVARNLRPKMGIEERVPEFVDEALRAKQAVAGVTNVLRQLPQTAMQQIAVRFNRCQLRSDSDHIADLALEVGEEALNYLRSTVRGADVAEAADMVGLLSRLDPPAVEIFLPPRLMDFSRAAQDRIVRYVASSGAHCRCRILLALLDHLDPLVMPLAIDEIGMTADREGLPRLLCIADGDIPNGASRYLQMKAIEALGRIHAPESVKSLKRIVETKKMFGWSYPQELRIAALQALEKLEPEWAHGFRPRCGIESADMTLAPLDVPVTSRWVRQRRHRRVRLPKPVTAVSTNLKEGCRFEIKTASLAGGVATINRHLPPGTQVQLKLQIGMRSLAATALMRDYRAQDMAFEIVDMSLEERSRYRRLLAESLPRDASADDAVESRTESVLTR